MGVLTYVVVATTKDAEYVCNDFLSDKFVWEDMPGLDLVLFSLYCMLTNKPLDTDFSKDFPIVFENDPDDGPWVRKVPDDFVLRLSEIKDDAAEKLSQKWKEADETFQMDDTPLEMIEGMLRTLRHSSKEAINEKKELVIWQSL
jgi:hypothetical protein